MKSIATTIAALVLCLFCYGQDWTTLKTNETFSIYVAKVDYDSPSDGIRHERVVFRYENHTTEPITLSFQRKVAYAPQAVSQTQEQHFEVFIPAGSSLGYEAETAHDKTFYLFSKDVKGTIKRALIDFELTNLETY